MERTVYEHVLPRLAESPLNYYGSVEESDGTANWLFLEDVGDQRYNPDLDLHRSRAGRWFGEMQAVVNRDDLPDTFPDRGADSYRDCLQTIFHAIPKFRDQGPVRRLGGDTLECITHSCRQLQARWDDVVEMCASVPIMKSRLSLRCRTRASSSDLCITVS